MKGAAFATLRFLLGVIGASALVPSHASGWQAIVAGGPAVDVAITPDDGVVVGAGPNPTSTFESSAFVVTKLAGATGQEAWRFDLGTGYLVAVSVDVAGNVVAAGVTYPSGIFAPGAVTVVKVSGSMGSELWRSDFSASLVNDVRFDPAGDVLVAGSIDGAGVVKLSGDSGIELWRYEVAGDVMSGVEIDPQSDVIAAGQSGGNSSVLHLAGASGAELWRKDFLNQCDVFLSECGRAVAAIAVNGSGHVAAIGYTVEPSADARALRRHSVLVLSGADGTELWRHEGSMPRAGINPPRLAFQSSGDLVASDGFAVATLAAEDGHELWQKALGCSDFDSVQVMTVDEGGQVIVGGSALGCLERRPAGLVNQFTVTRLSAAAGAELWRRTYDQSKPGNFFAQAAAATPSAGVVVAGYVIDDPFGMHPLLSSAVLEFSLASGALAVCGDGYVDVSEECDDGNVQDGDCCSSLCRAAPEGTGCLDDDACTSDDTCQQGRCVGGPALRCEPCGSCDPSTGCNIGAPVECKAPTASNTALVRLERPRAIQRRAVEWKWMGGAATTTGEFGDPTTTTGYAFCVFGDPAQSGTPVLLAASAPAGCSRTAGCWRATAQGFKYRSASRRPDGLRGISLKAGGAGRARITVKGKGRHLEVPSLPLTVPVTVELKKLDGSPPCWNAMHDLVLQNRSRQFSARGD